MRDESSEAKRDKGSGIFFFDAPFLSAQSDWLEGLLGRVQGLIYRD